MAVIDVPFSRKEDYQSKQMKDLQEERLRSGSNAKGWNSRGGAIDTIIAQVVDIENPP